MPSTLIEIQRRQAFIDRAEQQRGRFSDAVVDRVVEGHARAIAALRPRVREEADLLRQNLEAALEVAAQNRDALLEQSLRTQIGELPPEPELEGAVARAGERVRALQRELADHRELLQGWDEEEEVALPAPEPTPPPRRALLVCEEGTAAERVYPLNGHAVRIGRGRDNDLQLRGDSMVSRVHGELFEEDGRYFYADLASANGSRVNGDEIAAPRRLLGGEEIVIGATVIRFRIL